MLLRLALNSIRDMRALRVIIEFRDQARLKIPESWAVLVELPPIVTISSVTPFPILPVVGTPSSPAAETPTKSTSLPYATTAQPVFLNCGCELVAPGFTSTVEAATTSRSIVAGNTTPGRFVPAAATKIVGGVVGSSNTSLILSEMSPDA